MFELHSGYTVLTKEGCTWCTKVKDLLPQASVVACDEFLKDKMSFFKHVDTLTGTQYRMFPMVFFNKNFVGGYEETKTRIQTELTFDAVYF